LEDALYQTLKEPKAKFRIESPIEKPLSKIAEQKLIQTILMAQISKGNNTVNDISRELKEPVSFVRIELNERVTKGVIIIDKLVKPYKFSTEPAVS
jgi:hypothetical protein